MAQDKPLVYKLFNSQGENLYAGSSKTGEVADRLKDHLQASKVGAPRFGG